MKKTRAEKDTNIPSLKPSSPIVVESFYNAPTHQVWNSITDPLEMSKWFFEEIEEFETRVGFSAQFTLRANERVFIHVWNVLDVIAGKRITYGWKYDGYVGNSTVIWALSATERGTKLTLTHNGQETFPQDVPEFRRENCVAGWEYFIHNRLLKHLSKGT